MGSYSLLLTLCVAALQVFDSHQQCNVPADIVFVMDASSAVDVNTFNNQRRSLTNQIATMNIAAGQIHAGTVIFGSGPTPVATWLTSQSVGLVNTINGWTNQVQGTNTDAALTAAQTVLANGATARDNTIPKIIVLIANGVSNPLNNAIQQANALRTRGVRIVAVSAGLNNGNNQLTNHLAQLTGNQNLVFVANNRNNIQTQINQALTAACNPGTGGNTNAQFTECNRGIDIAFALDGSNSVTQQTNRNQINSLQTLANRLPVGLNQVNVAGVQYGGQQNTQMNQHVQNIPLQNSAATYVQALGRWTYMGGVTNAHSAINSARTLLNPVGSTRSKSLILALNNFAINQQAAVNQANQARANGIQVIVVGVGNGALANNLANLQAIAGNNANVFTTANGVSFDTAMDQAIRRACTATTVQQPQITECSRQIDITVALDGSNAVNQQTNQNQRNSLQTLANRLPFGTNQVNLGGVHYGGLTNGQLNQQVQTIPLQNTAQTFVQAIRQWNYLGGSTNAHSAINSARNIFNTASTRSKAIVLVLNNNAINQQAAVNQANQARANGIQVIVVGVGNGGSANNLANLQAIAGNNANVFTTANGISFDNIMVQALQRACVSAGTVQPQQEVCNYGRTDVYLVADVSRTTEGLSRQVSTNDFRLLKNGLSQFVSKVQNNFNVNQFVRMGLVSYSATSNLVVRTDSFNSLAATASSVQSIPNNIVPGGSNLAGALASINNVPQQGSTNSYVVIIAPNNVNSANANANNQVHQQTARLEGMGYTVVTVPVFAGTLGATSDLSAFATTTQNNHPASGYANLGNTLDTFEKDFLCRGNRPPKGAGMCANSGHETSGNTYVAHDESCMLYVQCYYDSTNQKDLAVIRKCPDGLFWNNARKMCDTPSASLCPIDQCRDSCKPYAMSYNCRGYYDCKNGVSTASCCSDGYMFVEGEGCVMDKMRKCMDYCNSTKMEYCMKPDCNRRPNWMYKGSYLFSSSGTSKWYTGPCRGKNFDALTCKCSAPRDHKCDPDRMFDFKDAPTVQQIQAGTKTGVTVTQGTYNNNGVTIPNRGMIHVDVASKKKNEPLTIKFKYRETASVLDPQYGTIVMSSSDKCSDKCYGSITMYTSTDFLGAVFNTPNGESAHIDLPTKGLSSQEFKYVTLVYDDGYYSLSIEGEHHHYMQKTMAPKGLYFPCGFDFGSTSEFDGFQGTFEMISISSCTPAKLYGDN